MKKPRFGRGILAFVFSFPLLWIITILLWSFLVPARLTRGTSCEEAGAFRCTGRIAFPAAALLAVLVGTGLLGPKEGGGPPPPSVQK